MILSLLFGFMADACCPKKAKLHFEKHGKHCCKKCEARAARKQPANKADDNILRPPAGHVAHSNGITKAVNKVKKHHALKIGKRYGQKAVKSKKASPFQG